MDLRNLAGRTALITGAGSGIGRATTLLLADRGADVFICDLNEAALKEVKEEVSARGQTAVTRRVDVSRRDEMEAFAEEVHRDVEAVDILMNNAGVGIFGGFQVTTLDDWDWILGVNLLGVIHGTHFFAPPMARRGSGHVINVSSAAGYMATEPLSAYSTTKFAVLGFSEAMRQELSRSGVGVTAICPGIINTPIVRSARMRGPRATPRFHERISKHYETQAQSPEAAAAKILKAVGKGRAVAPIGWDAHVAYYLKRLSPRLLNWLAGKANQRLERRQEQG